MVNQDAYARYVEKIKGKLVYDESADNKPYFTSWESFRDKSWYEKAGEEVNLWTFWQGRGHKNVEIMVVGQDWGNPTAEKNEITMANIENGEGYFANGAKKYPTDIALAGLFESIGIEDIFTRSDDRLFFTNFYLNYRVGKETGHMCKSKMMAFSNEFKELVEIISPKIIICLGKLTYDCACETLIGKDYNKSSNLTEYCNKLNEWKNFDDTPNGIRIYGMVHCGASGVNINRFNFTNEAPPYKTNRKISLMEHDWKQVKEYIQLIDGKSIDD